MPLAFLGCWLLQLQVWDPLCHSSGPEVPGRPALFSSSFRVFSLCFTATVQDLVALSRMNIERVSTSSCPKQKSLQVLFMVEFFFFFFASCNQGGSREKQRLVSDRRPLSSLSSVCFAEGPGELSRGSSGGCWAQQPPPP